MTEQTRLTPEEEDDLFKFDRETINEYNEMILIDAGEYLLEVDKFVRQKQIVGLDADKKEIPRTSWAIDHDYDIGHRIWHVTWTFRHKKDKNGELASNLIGMRHNIFKYDIAIDKVRQECGLVYQHLGFEGAYIPRYLEDGSEFVSGKGPDVVHAVRRFALFYISKFQDSQTKEWKNGNPQIVNDRGTKKQEAADAKGPVEV